MEQKEFDMLNQVVTKHANKDKAMKKKAKEERENKIFQEQKKA